MKNSKILSIAKLFIWVLALLHMLSGCNDEDDVLRIFTGKTWKMTYISADGNNKQYDFWNGDERARQKSMEALEQEKNFIVSFESTDNQSDTQGSFEGHSVLSNISGKWRAEGKDNELKTLNIKTNRTENDPLAKAFITGLQNAFKYSGDTENLFIYYKEGQTVKRIGLKPQK